MKNHLKMIDKKTKQVNDDIKKLNIKTIQMVEGGAKRLSAVDTGENRQKIETVILDDGATVHVYARAEHARYLEEGTSTTKAQPFLEPAFRQEMRGYEREVEKILAKEVN